MPDWSSVGAGPARQLAGVVADGLFSKDPVIMFIYDCVETQISVSLHRLGGMAMGQSEHDNLRRCFLRPDSNASREGIYDACLPLVLY